jgi:hypothetical protein
MNGPPSHLNLPSGKIWQAKMRNDCHRPASNQQDGAYRPLIELRASPVSARLDAFMWEEDPQYQQAHYRLLIGTLMVAVVAGLPLSWWTEDWTLYTGFLRVLGAILVALTIYAAMVWLIGQSVKQVYRRWRKTGRQ